MPPCGFIQDRAGVQVNERDPEGCLRTEAGAGLKRDLVLSLAFLLVPIAALGQGKSWEVEFHGGGAFVNALSRGGTGSLPAPGGPFTSVTGSTSRAVSSWYVGDGAQLVNEVLSSFGVSERITPLDSALRSRLGERGNGGGFGLRVGREITPRFGAEFNLDITSAPVNLTDGARAGIKASSDSFAPAFVDGLLSTGPFRNVTATSEFQAAIGAGRQIAATGALNIDLTTRGRVTPYATVGAGVIKNSGDAPSVDLNGGYAFNILGFFPFAERDNVQMSHATDDNVLIGVFGGGVKALLTQRSGIRVDARVHVGRHTIRTLLSADPDMVASPGPATDFAISSFLAPVIQLSNSEARGPTTLSGATIDDFESFNGDGVLNQVLVTVGYFWRF